MAATSAATRVVFFGFAASHVLTAAQHCSGVLSLISENGLCTEGAGTNMSLEEQSAHMAMAPYRDCNASEFPNTTVAGWRLVQQLHVSEHHGLSHDRANVYSHDGECAIAIAGSDDVNDWLNDFDLAKTDFCGFTNVHRGAARELEGMLGHSGWKDSVAPYLSGPQCSGGVTVIGHSLGGAMASLLAACANNGSRPLGFTAKALYTFGAFAVSEERLINKESADGCFAGARLYTQDAVSVDPAAQYAQNFGFRHPQVSAVRLGEPSFMGLPTKVYHVAGCSSECAAAEPSGGVPAIDAHRMARYTGMAKSVYTESRAELTESRCGESPLSGRFLAPSRPPPQ